MKKGMLYLAVLGALTVPVLLATDANAQATRTWVSGVGDDANPCSRTAPCKTFAGSISKTAAGGEINCLDSGGFGGVTITKSISILCDGVVGGALVSGTNGINVNSAGATVLLKGLDIEGVGTGLAGVRVFAATSVYIDSSVIHDFKAAANGWGILFAPSGAAELTVTNTRIYNNGDAASGGGILINAPPAATSKVFLSNVTAVNNFFGIKADGAATGGGIINVTIANSASVQNFSNGIVGTMSTGGAAVVMMIDHTAASHNAAGFGIIADGPSTTIRVGTSVVSGNQNGVGTSNSGTLQSYKTNMINNNSTDGTPIPAVPGGTNGLQ